MAYNSCYFSVCYSLNISPVNTKSTEPYFPEIQPLDAPIANNYRILGMILLKITNTVQNIASHGLNIISMIQDVTKRLYMYLESD